MIEKDSIIKKKQIKIFFRPTQIEQDKNACPMFLSAYERGKGRHSFGIIDFKRSNFNLEASVECDGVTTAQAGVSLCQGKINSFQRIKFKDTPELFASDKCKQDIRPTANGFEIMIKKDLCVYLFKGNNQYHRLTTFGFEDVLIY